MRVAKISPESIKAVKEFAEAADMLLRNELFSFIEPWANWKDLNDDDPDRLLMLDITNQEARNIGVHADRIDGRIVAYEFLRSKYATRLQHAIMTMEILLDNVQDPTSDVLAFYPSFYENHVAPEQ